MGVDENMDYDIRAVQLVELDILKKIDGICSKHGITYTEKNELSIKIKDDLFQLYKKSFDEYTNIIGLLKEKTIQLLRDRKSVV